jgi:hypothetical protein
VDCKLLDQDGESVERSQVETTDGRAAPEESPSFSSSSPKDSTGSDAEDPKDFKDNFRRIKARIAATANRPNDAAQGTTIITLYLVLEATELQLRNQY